MTSLRDGAMTAVSIEHDPPVNSDTLLYKILVELGLPRDQAEAVARMPCSAKRFYCDDQGELTEITLQHLDLRGRIPKELGALRFLRQLNLQVNQLKGQIPKQLGQLKFLEVLGLASNQLDGRIPEELGLLENLEWLQLEHNQLNGPIPRELSQLHSLRGLHLHQNQLAGSIPKELGHLTTLEELHLSQNQLTGQIPTELGQLQGLSVLDLAENQLQGSIPKELGQLQKLRSLFVYKNSLEGLPTELGQLRNLISLHLAQNQIRGHIPKELGQLRLLKKLDLSENALSGEIPQELSQLDLRILDLSRNQLSGGIAFLWNTICSLTVFDISHNALSGELNMEVSETGQSCQKLRHMDLSHNKFRGSLSKLVDIFCKLSPIGGSLQELRLNHNELIGEIPQCLMQFRHLTLLALNNNRLQGSLPEVHAPELVVLALHKNELSGKLPSSFHTLRHLGVLTLHENSIGGSISDIRLNVTCMDNSKFALGQMGCGEISLTTRGNPWFNFTENELRQIRSNCPTLTGCPRHGTANLTLHRNRFSCAVPERVDNVTVTGLVVMGNMLGSGYELASSWILPEEKQSFLYYSHEVWQSNWHVLCGFLLLLLLAAVCRPRQRLQKTLRSLEVSTTAPVASANFGLLPSFVEDMLDGQFIPLVHGGGRR